MSYLQRRALGGGKTPSRKAQSKAGSISTSKTTSKNPSRAASAAPSRNATDDEAWDSDGSVWSFGSLQDDLANLEDVPVTVSWQDDLADRIVRITDKDRKKLATGGLEEALLAYNRTLQSRYCKNEIEGKTDSIIEALGRSIKNGKTDKETTLACQAYALTLINDEESTSFGEMNTVLQRQITDHESLLVKVAAIHALGALTFFTDVSVEDVEGVMDFYHEIIENDGNTIGAGDDSSTVTAAIEEWGVLLTLLDDAEDITDRCSEAFVDQLDSTEIDVQHAAGEVIALIIEKAHRPFDADEDDSDEDPSDEDYHHGLDNDEAPPPVQKYTYYNNIPHLRQLLTELTRSSAKSVSKKNRRQQHATFASVLHTLNYPLHGPNYSRALDLDGREHGSRLEVKIGRKGVVKLNTWWKAIRWNGFKRFLGSGLIEHFQNNTIIFQYLPVILEIPPSYKEKGRKDRLTLSPYD